MRLVKTHTILGMRAVTPPFHDGVAAAELPTDLRDWVGEWGLIGLALDAVQAEAPGARWAVETVPENLCAPMMLTLLTYCYAAGIYASEDVEAACDHNAQVRYICARQYPSGATIRHFRRANRPLVERCLTRTLTEALKRQTAEAGRRGQSNWQPEALEAARIRELAEYKLQTAVLMDISADD